MLQEQYDLSTNALSGTALFKQAKDKYLGQNFVTATYSVLIFVGAERPVHSVVTIPKLQYRIHYNAK